MYGLNFVLTNIINVEAADVGIRLEARSGVDRENCTREKLVAKKTGGRNTGENRIKICRG